MFGYTRTRALLLENGLPLTASFIAYLDRLNLFHLVQDSVFSLFFIKFNKFLLLDSSVRLLPLLDKREEIPRPLLLLDDNQLEVFLEVRHDLGKQLVFDLRAFLAQSLIALGYQLRYLSLVLLLNSLGLTQFFTLKVDDFLLVLKAVL